MPKMNFDEFKEYIECAQDERIQTYEAIKDLIAHNPKTRVFIWGGGIAAIYISKLLTNKCGILDFSYVVSDEYLNCKSFVPKENIIAFSEYLDNYINNSILVIGYSSYLDAEKMKNKYSDLIPHLYDFNYAWANSGAVEWSKQFVEDNISAFYETYEMLADELSRNTMVEYIKASITGKLEKLFVYNCKEQYFNDLIKDYPVNTFVDCGAFDGDTIHTFLQKFKTYDKIYAFEPDLENVKLIEKRIKDENIQRVNIITAGVYSINGELCFNNSNNNESHYILEQGDNGIRVPVKTIDSLEDNEINFIKMDVEGSELKALQGARKLIKNRLPALAICVYHKKDDLITIPQYISDLVQKDSYNYYLRHHGENLVELVLYAIPKEI